MNDWQQSILTNWHNQTPHYDDLYTVIHCLNTHNCIDLAALLNDPLTEENQLLLNRLFAFLFPTDTPYPVAKAMLCIIKYLENIPYEG